MKAVMGERVFVKVVGFTDVERHALNTMFRLSDERVTTYVLWAPDAPESPKLALIDGQTPEARQALESPNEDPDMKLIWVGAITPAHASRTFVRPLNWPEVVQAMDELFGPEPVVDFDLDFEPVVQVPPRTGKRTLITGMDAGERFYLRAKLSSVGLLDADEAATGAEVQELLKANTYQAILFDLDLPDVNGWELLRKLTAIRPAVPVIAMTSQAGLMARLRAWVAGAQACLGKPPHPGKLQTLLQAIEGA
ncbi:MAG: response regulator [Burkholderiaceae bacterium]|nr:response regulator [Burkholderiaceae bacterium]